MQPVLIEGKVMIPTRGTNPQGDIWDGYVEMKPTDPDYAHVFAWCKAQERPE
jgi:hypothetical protein